MTNKSQRRTVAIIGGGFTGAVTAWNIARAHASLPLRIVVFEPRARLGAGLAYDSADPVHRINVPASRMSVDPAMPADFEAWLAETGALREDPDALIHDGRVFPRRSTFGAYVSARLAPFVATGVVEHIRAAVQSLDRIDGRWRLTSDDGAVLDADRVVIATSHPAPSAPRALASILEGHPRFIADATIDGALSPIRQNDSVLIVGNGLTSADVAASLLLNGHKGAITSISRRGLRSRGHSMVNAEPHGDFVSRPIRSARLLTRRVREAIEQAKLFDVSWHAVIDAARSQAQQIWANLPLRERIRLLRHMRPYWDVHRFRIAPQIESAIEQAIARGQMQTLAASVGAVSYHGQQIRAALRQARRKGALVRDFDAVVVTTGPAHGGVLQSQAYLSRLAEAGLIAADPTELGLSCDLNSRILGRDGCVVGNLYVAGPLARGAFGELMGLPQVSEHAKTVAMDVLKSLEADQAAFGESPMRMSLGASSGHWRATLSSSDG